jgi:hypothetical protein
MKRGILAFLGLSAEKVPQAGAPFSIEIRHIWFIITYYRKGITMARVLKLSRHNAAKEIDFELAYLKSLSVKQRFALMYKKTREIINLLEKHGHRRPFEIIKRT